MSAWDTEYYEDEGEGYGPDEDEEETRGVSDAKDPEQNS